MKKTIVISQYLLPVSVVPDGDGFLASCPNWNDCYAQWDTVDEAISEIMGVAGTLIELYQEEGKRIPLKLKKSSTSTRTLRVDLPLVVTAAS